MSPTQKYSILLVDDHEIICDVVKVYLASDERFQIISEANNGVHALKLINKKAFNLIITDIRMPVMDGITLTRTIKSEKPDQKIIALTVSGEHSDITQLLAAGVNGYLLKSSPRDEIIRAINIVISGENYYSEEVTQVIISQMVGGNQSKLSRIADNIKELIFLARAIYQKPKMLLIDNILQTGSNRLRDF